MSNPSNLYAEKIFAEHPSVLWSLDDQADYISIIDDSDRDISLWHMTGGNANVFTDITTEPFNNSIVVKISGDDTSSESGSVSCISNNIINFTQLNENLSTFAIGTYFYSMSSYLAGIEIGYEYDDTTTGATVQKLKNFSTSISEKWIFVSETFDIPSENTELRLVIKVNYIGGAPTGDYQFLVNGLTLGQWAEEFNSVSLGTSKISLPENIYGIDNAYGIKASAYGLQDKDGYYIVKDNSLVAKNTGVPMIYGSSNITKLSYNDGSPSIIFPGLGFLNESGKNKEYTAEMWMRINSDSIEPKKIFGPLNGNDGLFVNGPFLMLKIDDHIGQHFVGEWNRPMLIHIRMTSSGASLLVNGEQVVTLNFDPSTISLPDILQPDNTVENDWVGFWCHADVDPIDIDCFAIYPYQVPSLVAKRRFVYGQGVEFPEGINQAYSGTSTFIDYPFANYTNNYSYPESGAWSRGIVDNLSTLNGVLSAPEYSLPSFVFSNKTEETFYNDCDLIQNYETDNLITFRPNNSWNQTEAHIFFNNFNILNDEVKAFFGVFKLKSESESHETLIRVQDRTNNNYFSIDVLGLEIKYTLKFFNEETVVYTAYANSIGEKFAVGIDIDNFVREFGGNVAEFFGSRSQLVCYVGGTKELSNTFTGNIYRVGFSSKRNLYKLKDAFNFAGVPLDYENIFDYYSSYGISEAGLYNTTLWEYVMDGGTPSSFAVETLHSKTASYTLVPQIFMNNFTIDIDIDSYWEDYVPLSFFAKYVDSATGKSYYDLDFLQFNINYPSPSIYKKEDTVSEWKYGELTPIIENGAVTGYLTSLQSEYASPIQKTYSSLDNQLFTGYENYTDLMNRSFKTYSYDTSNSILKSYITFQYIQSGANNNESYFSTIKSAPKNGVVEVDNNWMTTKYEVVDNMVIYPPRKVDFRDIAIVVHLNFDIKAILKNKIKVRSLQLASQAFNENSFNPIGTRFGTNIYPYKKTGLYYDYKSANPFTIYKGSTPYFYLTRYSGIQLRGDYDPDINRGLSIPVNTTKANNYKVMAVQAYIRYDEDFFPYAPTQILEINDKDTVLKFYLVANDSTGKRAKIYAINANTGQVENGIGFYWNGNIVKEPVITIKEWGVLGVSFANLLNFSNYLGSIKINGPILVNNISHYQSTNLQEVQQVTQRPWFKVKRSGALTLDWDYWAKAYYWQGMMILSSINLYGVNPSDIYKTFIGTNKIIVDDSSILRFKDYQYSAFTDVLWQAQVSSAV